jgi:hypothetical protein
VSKLQLSNYCSYFILVRGILLLSFTVNANACNNDCARAARYSNTRYANVNKINCTNSFTCDTLNDSINNNGEKWEEETVSIKWISFDNVLSSNKVTTIPEVHYEDVNIIEGNIHVNKLKFIDSELDWYYFDAIITDIIG